MVKESSQMGGTEDIPFSQVFDHSWRWRARSTDLGCFATASLKRVNNLHRSTQPDALILKKEGMHELVKDVG